MTNMEERAGLPCDVCDVSVKIAQHLALEEMGALFVVVGLKKAKLE